ncbi:MAG: hypothetical protein IJM27_09705 [Eubacterium sp.]|nr:hypothetical protein [Eubacterium sp.]
MDEQNFPQGNDPFTQQADDPFAKRPDNTYGQPQVNPYGQPQANPYGQPQANPYGQPQANPYGQPQANPYGQPQANPYGQPQANPYGQPQANPYGQPQANPYGQPQADPYGQQANPYAEQQAGGYPQQPGANPYAPATSLNPYGAGAPVPPKPPKKKMSGKMKALIFGGIGLVAIGVGLFFLFTMVIFPPKKTLKSAVEKTFNGSEGIIKDSPLIDEMGGDDIMKNLRKGGSIDVQIKGKDGVAKDVTIDLGVAKDDSAKRLSGKAVLSGNGESVDAELFADENQTYVTVKDLINGYISINNQNVISTLVNAPVLQDQDLSSLRMLNDFSLNYFGDSEGGMLSKFVLNEEFWDAVSVSSDGKDKINIGSETVTVNKYKVTVPKSKIDEWVDKAIDAALNSANNSAITKYLERAGLGDASQLKDRIKPILKSIFPDDFPFWIYVEDERVVGAKLNGKLTIAAYSIDYDVEIIAYGDDDKSKYGITGSITMMGQKIGLTATCTTTKEGNSVKTNVILSLEAANVKAIDANYNQTYDTSSKTITGSGSLSVKNEEVAQISVNGKVTESTSGKSFSLELDDIKLTAQGKSMSFSMKADVKTLEGGATVASKDDSKKVCNIGTCTKEELKAMSSEELLEQLGQKIQKIFEQH